MTQKTGIIRVLSSFFSILIYLSLVFRPVFTELLHYIYHELSHTLYLHHTHPHDEDHLHAHENEHHHLSFESAKDESEKHGHTHTGIVDYFLSAGTCHFEEDVPGHPHAEYYGGIPFHNYPMEQRTDGYAPPGPEIICKTTILRHQYYLKPLTLPPESL